MSDYLRIDERINIIDSFEKARDFLLNKKSLLDLKWFVISFHHAMHNLMLYTLVDSAGGGIWIKDTRRNLPILNSDGTVDIFNRKNRLLSFIKAFEYVQDSSMMGRYINSKPFIAKPYHLDSMYHLNNRLRNKFVHYSPISWSIHEQYIYEICKPVLEIASFLVLESKQCGFEEDEKNKLKNIFDEIEKCFIDSKVK